MTPDTLKLYHSPLMTESRVAAVATTDAKSKPRMFLGLTMGLLAAAIGALYSVYATYGLARGLKPADMTFLRTGVAGLLTLPVLVYYLRFDAKVLTGQWRRWLAVAVLALINSGIMDLGYSLL